MAAGRYVRITFYFLLTLLILACIALSYEVYFRMQDRYGHEGITWISGKGVTGIEYSPTEIWRWRKWMNDKITNAEGHTFIVHTDRFGFRNHGKTVAKPDPVIRILVLGDSYTEALNIADDQIFESLLEKNLSGLKPGGNSIEVVSASSPGWGTDQELRCLQNEAMEFQPDYILLMACPNDIREAWCKKFAVMADDRSIQFNPIRMKYSEIFLWWLAGHSRLFQYLQQEYFHTAYGTFAQLRSHYSFTFGREDATNWDRPLFLTHPYPAVDSARVLFDTLIASMQTFCGKRNIHFAVSLTPTLMEYNGTIGADSATQSGLVSDMLQQFCRSRKLDYIDIYECFKKEDTPASCFMAPDAHFSSRGHRITADVLAGYYRHIFSNDSMQRKQ